MINKKNSRDDGFISRTPKRSPSACNPFYTDDFVYDVEKKDSIKDTALGFTLEARTTRLPKRNRVNWEVR